MNNIYIFSNKYYLILTTPKLLIRTVFKNILLSENNAERFCIVYVSKSDNALNKHTREKLFIAYFKLQLHEVSSLLVLTE